MPFWIAYANGSGARNGATEQQLQPKPTLVRYPEGPSGGVIETAGGSVVVQQFTQDARTREWVWMGYPAWYPAYQTLWGQLEPLRSRYRKMAGDATPYVYLKEDETQLFRTISVSGTTVTPTYDWLRCRVLSAHRVMRDEGSSLVVYQQTVLRFVIDDPAYNDLG